MADQAREDQAAGASGVGGIIDHNGSQYEVLFFASEAAGDPFDVLRSAARRVAVSNRSSVLPQRTLDRRRFVLRDADHPDRARRLEEARGREDEEDEEPEEPAEAATLQSFDHPGARGSVQISGPLGQMIQEMLMPQGLPDFVARHEALRANVTATNARPRPRPRRHLSNVRNPPAAEE